MSEKTNIAWCDSTANFWSGCTKVSPGCANCYAEKLSLPRFFGGGKTIGQWGKGAERKRHESAFKMAFSLNRKPWICNDCGNAEPDGSDDCRKCGSKTGAFAEHRHRRRIFSLSLGDWLDEEVPIEWLAEMLDTIRQCDQVIWILCTKRPENFFQRLLDVQDHAMAKRKYDLSSFASLWLSGTKIPAHIWLLTSVENQPMADKRIPELLKIPAVCRGLSLEPLLGSVDLTKIPVAENPMFPGEPMTCLRRLLDPSTMPPGLARDKINWLIIGGESGPGARTCNVDWIRFLVHQGRAAGVATFVKQLGAASNYETVQMPTTCRSCKRPIAAHLGWCTYCDWHPKNKKLTDKKGGDPAEWPSDLQVQEFPVLPPQITQNPADSVPEKSAKIGAICG